MTHTVIPGERISRTTEVYIEFLAKNIGASREEILEVIKRSGISARRIAEYIVEKQPGLNIRQADMHTA